VSRRNLVNRIAATTGHPKTHVDQVLVRFLEELGADLAEEGQVQLRGFGGFRTVELPARVGRNPRTGEPVDIPARRHVRFRAYQRLRDVLNP